MTVEQARPILLGFNGVIEGFHHGHPDYRVNKRIFATLWPDENRVVLMLGPEPSEALAAERGGSFRVVGGGKCLTFNLTDMEEPEFSGLTLIAYQRFSTWLGV